MLIQFIVLALLLISNHAGAQASKNLGRTQELLINADSSESDSQNETTELKGNVQIIFKDQHLKCDRAKVNYRSKILEAEGHVLIITPQANIGAQSVVLDYETNTGILYDGYVQSGSVLFEGNILYKTGDYEYIAETAKYTACTNCPETWSFTGKKIRAQIGGYAFIKSSTMRIGGVPVFWLPYLVVPLKSERQTGLLTPEFEQSDRGGTTLSESFFWAMSPSQDSTWTFKNYEYRGPKGLLNYRYVLNEKSKGEFDTAFIQDRVFANDERLNTFRSEQDRGTKLNRWFLKYNHYYDLPDGYVHRAQLNNASDLQYPKDYPNETLNHGDPAMENRMSITKNFDKLHLSIDSSYYINLLQSDPTASNEEAVHRLPELKLNRSIDKIGRSDFLYNFDLTYTNFARTGFAYDDLNSGYSPNNSTPRQIDTGATTGDCFGTNWERYPYCKSVRDGTYNKDKDLLRTGQRIEAGSSVYRPFNMGRLDFLSRLGYRETRYQFNAGDDTTIARRYLKFDIDMKTSFNRVYAIDSSERIKHEFEPLVGYTTIPWIYHPTHPFFGNTAGNVYWDSPFSFQDSISDNDLNSPLGLQFDYNDRIFAKKMMTLGIMNRLTRKTWVAGQPAYKQFVTWKLSQSFDFAQNEKDDINKQPFSDVLSELSVNLDRLSFTQQANYYPYPQVTNTSTRIRVYNSSNDFFEIFHNLNYSITPAKEPTDKDRTETYTVALKKSSRILDVIGRVTFDINPPPEKENRKISSYGYGVQLGLPGDCWSFTFTQHRATDGENVFNASFDYSFTGQGRTGLPEVLLDKFNN